MLTDMSIAKPFAIDGTDYSQAPISMAKVMWEMWAEGDGTVKVAELARLARVKLGYE